MDERGGLREAASEDLAFNAFMESGSLNPALQRSVNESMNYSMSILSQDVEDEDMLEEALSKLEARLSGFRTHSKMMHIGNMKYEINDKDPVFFLTGPVKTRKKTVSCHRC